MKKTLQAVYFCMAALLTPTAAMAGNDAFVFAENPPVGGIIKKNDLLFALMLREPCMLRIPNGNFMLMAAIFNNRSNPDKPDVGCWALTTDPSKAEIIVVGPTGHVTSGMSLTEFTKASLLASGDAKVIGPAMTQQQFNDNLREYEKSRR
ncbi:hypothetical protein [Burkholderia gladioli]|uniref:hypothetical protein n=1 Tax=Burkholderia gladioli TaxID=28095 RepID=UPI00265513DB|nr:hypothetical protein [Burkholderia gladioli]MDN7803094.1 hypothetical protein [Burkholderia gladioli]